MLLQQEGVGAQVERILCSEALRNSEALRRLFQFLAQRSLSGEADGLKEYSIGIDVLGKPATYDPRRDSTVRIQISRLRHKLADYYQTEGKDDPILVELPKGHFKLTFAERPQPTAAATTRTAGALASLKGWRWAAMGLAVALVAALAWAAYLSIRLGQEQTLAAPVRAAWTPELQELWRPILASNRPLIVSVGAPLFVGLQGEGLYRDLSLNRWEDVAKSPKIGDIRRALGNPPIIPRYYYTGLGITNAAFQLGKLLSIGKAGVSVTSSSQLTWQQLADSDVLYIGASRTFTEQLAGLPVEFEFGFDEKGVRNLHPGPGERATLADAYPVITENRPPIVRDDGVVHALITHTPGPIGTGDIVSFISNHSPGAAAAVQSFTTPALARMLAGKLRGQSGELPRYYQIVLRVKYKDAVPTEISYVMHRELHPEKRPPPAEK